MCDQAYAHGRKTTPRAFAYLTGGPASYVAPSLTVGTIDATNIHVTAALGWKYRIHIYP